MGNGFSINTIMKGIPSNYGIGAADLQKWLEDNTSVWADNKKEDGSFDYEKTLEEYQESVDAVATEEETEKTSLIDKIKNFFSVNPEATELEQEKEKNEEKMAEIEKEIDELVESAKEKIAAALARQESAKEEHEEDTKNTINEEMQKYIEANKNGEGMTKDELKANIRGAIPEAEIADAAALLVDASEEIAQVDDLLGELKTLIDNTACLESQIEAAATASTASTEPAESEKCDPIGFTNTDANGNQAQYDFIVDDGKFDSTSDFLGAQNQWAEMQALDTDGDDIVSSAELKAGNIKAVKTDAEGNQTVVDLATEFGDDLSIDLNSYVGDVEAALPLSQNDANNNGVADVTTLGYFTVNLGDEKVKGYNTLDDVEWLEDTYNISAPTAEPTTPSTPGEEPTTDSELLDASKYSEDLQAHVKAYNTGKEQVEAMKEQIEQGYEYFDLTEEQIKELDAIAEKNAEVESAEKIKNINDTVDTEFETIRAEHEATKAAEKAASTAESTLPEDVASKLDAKLGEGFSARLAELAQKYGLSEQDLVGLMYSECGLQPDLVNEIGATGLIQFIPETAQSLGTSTDALANMSAVEQLEYVDKFLGQYLDEGGSYSAGELYTTVFLPAFLGQDILTSQGDGTGYYDANSGLDIDGNGDISTDDLTQRIKNKYQEALANL